MSQKSMVELHPLHHPNATPVYNIRGYSMTPSFFSPEDSIHIIGEKMKSFFFFNVSPEDEFGSLL